MWSLVIIGAIAGHLVTISNFLVIGGWYQDRQAIIDEVVQRAVSAAIKECVLDIPKTPPIDPSPPVFEGPKFSWSLEFILKLSAIWIFGVLVGFLSLRLCLWCLPGLGGRQFPPEENRSPGNSPAHIGDLARHQLAELRLRRNESQRSIRAA